MKPKPTAQLLAALARCEARRCVRSLVWLVGAASMGLVAFSESDVSPLLGCPSSSQALYSYQLATSMLLGILVFLMAANSISVDLDGSRRDLLASRPLPTPMYLAGKFLGVSAIGLMTCLPILLFCVFIPLSYGRWTAHPPGPFVLVTAVSVMPLVAYSCALGMCLTAWTRRVIVALPIFLIYFFGVALMRFPSETLPWLDFSMRLYPEQLSSEIPIRLRDYSFASLLSPVAPALWLRTVLYLGLSAAVLTLTVPALRWNVGWRITRRRCRAGGVDAPIRAFAAVRIQNERTNESPTRASPITARFTDEWRLLFHSTRLLLGRNLLALGLVVAGLLFTVLTYAVGQLQTRAGVLLLQLEIFGPLLGIVVFSDLGAPDLEPGRTDLLRVSVRGAAWAIARRLAHAALFTLGTMVVVLLFLRFAYTRFNLFHSLLVLFPGAVFFGMIGLLATALTGRATVGYATGTAAMILYGASDLLHPLTSTSFFLSDKLARAGFLHESNWLLVKLALLMLGVGLAFATWRLIRRPERWRRIAIGSTAFLFAVHGAARYAWKGADGNHDDGRSTTLVLRPQEEGNTRFQRTATTTRHGRGPQELVSTTLLDSQWNQVSNQWQLAVERPVDLTREVSISNLRLDVEVDRPAGISVRARLEAQVLESSADELLLFLAHELAVTNLSVNGRPAAFEQSGDLVRVVLSTPGKRGDRLDLEIAYAGRLRLPQHWRFEGATRQLLFVTSRWFPSLASQNSQQRNLTDCSMTVRLPPGHTMAGGTLQESQDGKTIYRWNSGSRVENVPLCVGRFKEYGPSVGERAVRFYSLTARPEVASTLLLEASRALAFLEQRLGPYPYRSLAIVENPFQGAGGQAQPSMVCLHPDRLVPEHLDRVLEGYVAHEIAHLWYGNGMPQWLAEGAAVFANAEWLEHTRGSAKAAAFMDIEFYEPFLRAGTGSHPLIGASGVPLYTKGGYFFLMLGQLQGKDSVFANLRSFRESVAADARTDSGERTDAFLQHIESAGTSVRTEFVEGWTRGVKRYDPRLRSVEQQGDTIRLDLRHQGEISFPVPVRVSFADGKTRDLEWDSVIHGNALELRSSSQVRAAELDPKHLQLDFDRSNNRWVAEEPASLAPGLQDVADLGWTNFSVADGLPEGAIKTLVMDRQGQVWAAGGSFNALQNREWAVSVFQRGRWTPYRPAAACFDLISTLAHSASGNLWLGSQSRVRVMRGDAPEDYMLAELRRGESIGRGRFSPNPNSSFGVSGSRIYQIFIDGGDDIWFATDHGLTRRSREGEFRVFNNADGFQASEIFAVVEGADSTIWAGTDRGAYRWDGAVWRIVPGTEREPVFALASSSGGALWMACRDLLCFQNGALRRFSPANAPIPDAIYSSLACDRKGGLWAACSKGLVYYNGNHWKVFTRSNSGLLTDKVHRALADDVGRVWLGTDSGVSVFARDTFLRPVGREASGT